jgi:isochorismate pyruvate lyase
MAELRVEIDRLDADLVALLAERARYIDRATEIKAEVGLPARIDARVAEVISNAREAAAARGLDPDLVEALWTRIVEWSIAREAARLEPGGREA